MKSRWGLYIIAFIIGAFLSIYKLDYYVMKPGGAYEVGQFITVQDGDEDDEGSFSLMTVSMYRATPVTYLYAKLKDYYEIVPVTSLRQEEEDDEEYNVRQLHLMTSSQFNALHTAFSKAELPYNVTYKGVYVLNILTGGAADGVIKPGDEIVEVDGERITNQAMLVERLNAKKKGDRVGLVINRNDELIDETVTLKEIPHADGRIGLGISFAESKSIKTDPKVHVDSEEIGGPSAGLMFTLEILNQLKEEDLTKGYAVAGTGEMLIDGSVGRIGGVEKKVVAADKAGMEIFFVPDDEISEEVRKNNPHIQSNYEAALKTAKAIKTNMQIVPVKTIDDALQFLENLEEK